MQVDEPTKTERANYVELREVLQCTNLKKIQFWTQPWDSFINSPFFFFFFSSETIYLIHRIPKQACVATQQQLTRIST